MDLFTFIGWTILIVVAYKLGVYVEARMKRKARAREAQVDAERDAGTK